MAKTYKITFVGDPARLKAGWKMRHFGPGFPSGGLLPGESVTLHQLPECVWGSKRYWFLVDGKPYEGGPPRKAAEKPKPLKGKETIE